VAEVTIEIDDKGEIGTLPEPLQKFLDKRINEAYQKGADKSEKALKSLIVDPKEIERLKAVEKDFEDQRIALLERDKNYEEAQKMRDKRHQDELEAERKAHGKTKTKVREFVAVKIRAAAVEAGARSESLDELERLIGADIDLDADLNPFVKDAEGKPLEKDGKQVDIEGYVQAYLDKKPHHKAAPSAKGGKAQGGAAMRGQPAAPANAKEAAFQRAADAPTAKNINDVIGQILPRSA
jgi:hypothetical protein